MTLAFPRLWPTIWVLASDYSKKHNRTTRYIRPHLASVSDRNISDSWDIDVDEWGKSICKTFYFLAVVAVIPFPCYALASCMLCKLAFGNVFSNRSKNQHQIYHILNQRCIDCSDIELRRAAFYLAHGIFYIVAGFAGYLYDSFFLFWTNKHS